MKPRLISESFSMNMKNPNAHCHSVVPAPAMARYRVQLTLGLALICSSFVPRALGANIVAEFDGSAGRVITTGNVDLNNRSFTIMAWVRRGKLDGAGHYFLSQGRSGTANQNNGLHLGFSDDKNFRFGFFANDLNVSDANFADGNWHHWTATYSSTNRVRRLYRDGVQVGTDTSASHYLGTGLLALGGISYANDTNNVLSFPGGLDEVKVYQRELTADEVVASVRNFPVSTNNLVEFWPFDLDDSTRFLSAVTNGHHLTKLSGVFSSYNADLHSANHVANFDGLNDRLESADPKRYLTNRSFTVMAWARRMGGRADDFNIIFSHGTEKTTDKYLHFGFRPDSRFTFAFWGDDLDGPFQEDFTWHHWAGTFDVTTKARNIYRDGLLVASDTAKGTFQGSGLIGVGCGVNIDNTWNWLGHIDEVKLFESALNQSEVRAEMDTGLNSTARALEYWSFEQETSTNFAGAISEGASTALVKKGGVASMPDDPANKFNGSVHLTGSGTAFSAPIGLDNRSFTLMAWARKNVNNNKFQMIFTHGTTDLNRGLHFGFRNNNVFTFAFWGNDLNTPVSYNDFNWHHWTGTYDAISNTRRIYLDGTLVASDVSPDDYHGVGGFEVGYRYWKYVDAAKVQDLRRQEDDLSRAIKARNAHAAALRAQAGSLGWFGIVSGLWSSLIIQADTADKDVDRMQAQLRDLQNREAQAYDTWDSEAIWTLNGDIDEPRVFNRALNPDEVRSEAVRFGSTGLLPDLQAGWTLDSYDLRPGLIVYHPLVQGGADLQARGGVNIIVGQLPVAMPSIAPLPNLRIDEDATAQTVSLSGIYDEAPDQLVSLKVGASCSDNALIKQFQFSFVGTNTTGTLQFTPAPDANGVAAVTVSATRPYGGLTLSGSRSFTLSVNSINDLPVPGSPTSVHLRTNSIVSVGTVQGLPTGNQAHTASAWVRLAATVTSRSRVLALGDLRNGALEWTLETTNNANRPILAVGVWGNLSEQIRLPNVVTNGGWVHLASTWDGDMLRVYVNGILSGVSVPTPAKGLFNLQGIGLRLGFLGVERGMDGNFDEVQVWDRALTDSEIQANLNRPLNGREPGLVLYWRFDEGEDDRATDSAVVSGSKTALSQGLLTGGAFYEKQIPAGFGVITVDEDKSTPIFIPAFDLDSPLTYAITALPLRGSLSRTNGDWNNLKHNPITYRPAPNFTGADSFTYQLNDGFTNSAPVTLQISVVNVNDPPTVSDIPIQLVDEAAVPRLVSFTVSDPETAANNLILSAVSSDQKLIPNANLTFGGSGTNRTLSILPPDGELGRCKITLSVSDTDAATTVKSFEVVVLRHTYAVIDLGTLPNRNTSFGTAINDQGWVVGYSQNNAGDAHAFVFQGIENSTALVDLNTLGGATSQAWGLSSSNQIVGVSATGDRFQHAFWLKDTESPMTDVGTLLGGTSSRALGINGKGLIVGTSASLLNPSRAFFRDVGVTSLTDLGTFSGPAAQATAINDFGSIVGFSRLDDGTDRAFLYEDGVMNNIGTLPDHNGSRAWGINPSGLIVGESITNSASQAFIYRAGAMTSLGLLATNGVSTAYGINDIGQVVGTASVDQGRTHAFLFSAGQMLDMNNLIPIESGWELTEARGINRNGAVVGTGIINGRQHAFLALPATPIGRPVARPAGAIATRFPEIDLLDGQEGDTPVNSFFWVPVEGRLYAIRPVTARIRWSTSSNVSDTNRITTITANVWPRVPQVYVANTPVEIEPRGVPFPYSFQSLIYNTTAGVSVDSSTKIFQSTRPGWTVAYYLKTNGEAPDPQSQHPYFEVVKRVSWDDANYLRDKIPWLVGHVITNATHSDYLKKQGYVYFPKSPYDGAGEDRAHDRDTRLGPIIPVNLDKPAADDDLVVVWYHTNKIGVAWSNEPTRYTLAWPANAPHIIIASGLGSGPLSDAEFPNRKVYDQPDPADAGYNPNEEHAIILPGASGEDALFSLRNDLNRIVGVSEPFSLLKFKDRATGEWRIKVFLVVTEEAPYFFRYSGEAGKEIAPPYPLSVLPLCDPSYGVSGPYWEDVRGKLYAKAAGPFGSTTNIIARFFYPLQPGFFYDLNRDGIADAPLNDCTAWLDRLPGGKTGQPVDIRYDIRWPDDPPVLQVGETLFNSKHGLPGVRGMAKAAIVFDDLTDTIDATKHGAQLYDPMSERTYRLLPTEAIPDFIKRQNISGKDIFPDLAFPLRVRLKYDPINRWLIFSGYLDESGIGSNPLLLPNILTTQERDSLLKLATGNPTWKQIIDKLYVLTRNPNQLDLNRDGKPDDRVLVGQLANGTTLFQEAFGALPKALTAGFSDVPPAQPRPGTALDLTGAGQMSVPGVGPLNDFTIGVWAKFGTISTGFLFRDSGGGNAFSLKAETSTGKLIATEGSAVPHDFGYAFDSDWHFFALVRDMAAGKVFVYVDGRPLGESFPVQGAAYTGGIVVGAQFNGQLEEFQVWNAARGGNAMRARMDRALNGAEDGLQAYYTFNDVNLGLSGVTTNGVARTALNATITNGQRVTSTAPVGIPPRFVVVSENNDLALGALPISLKVIRIEDGPYAGDLKVIYPDNVFDERLTFRHSNDFAGDPDQVEFEWYYKPDAPNFDSSLLPTVSPEGSIDTVNGWIRYSKSGRGVNQITIGEGGESGLLTLGDNWFICRFRGYAVGNRPKTDWSDWVGDPASVGIPAAILGEGWVKRVIRGLNPFDARVKDFHSSPVSTFASMLVQAGQRYEGDIAFNPNAENLNRIGLIEAYQTVLNRGRNLSIDGIPAVDFSPANNALLLAASRISDLYVLLGNEGYADAQDPTIGFGTKSGAYGSLASSIFTFQNQLDSLLEEELTLLRGRDDSAAGVQGAPVFNRLFWNFTLGEGEVAYQQTYNVTDQNKDGFIDEKDARILYPQGHGDAWGHYLTALTTYYDLLHHPNYTWIPRAESVLVAGTSVQVDFLDERKFAKAAGLKAKAGVEIMNLTYRLNYVDDPSGQWQGYKDTQTDRAWGVTEWAWRAGQGAYFDWVVANAILPAHDTNHPPGIQKIDRTTVTELSEIPTQYDQIQTRMDQADIGLNPIGLAKGVVPFDIDPAFLEIGAANEHQSHYEQIQQRALKAMNNAVLVWNEANSGNNLIRENQDTVQELTQNTDDQERDFKNRLIEVFGYPYAGDIGPGQTYPSGYDGPDLYHYMYVATKELNGETAPPTKAFKAFLKPLQSEFKDQGLTFPNDTPLGPGQVNLNSGVAVELTYPVSAKTYAYVAPASWGQRRAPGELQQAISDMVQAEARLKQSIANYDKLLKDVKDLLQGIEGQSDLRADRINVLNTKTKQIKSMGKAIAGMQTAVNGLKLAADIAHDAADAAAEALPKSVGLATDVTSAGRAALKIGLGVVVKNALNITETGVESAVAFLEEDKETAANTAELELEKLDVKQQELDILKQVLSMMRDEPNLRLEMYNQKEVLAQTAGRYQTTLANGQRILDERLAFRQRTAAATTQNRYQDMTFRIFRNDALQKYRAQFDLAARYVFLAATAYDYETCLLGSDGRSGREFLKDIIRHRSLGQVNEVGVPIPGRPGLADALGRMSQNYDVLKTQLGFNNPQIETGRFSFRSELFRLLPDSEDVWREELKKHRVANLWDVPEFRRYCRPFAPEELGPQPGVVIRFPTTVTFGQNFFGWPLAGGDSAYDASRFSTKIRSVGVWFSDYNGNGLSLTPRVYLVPAGMDVLRSPTSGDFQTREWRVVDQVLPVPFPIGGTTLKNPSWRPDQSLGGSFADIRKFASFRAFHDGGSFDESEAISDSRLIGRSVWNTDWMLIIPGGTFLADQNQGLDTFIDGVSDIKIFFETYSYSGN